MPKERRKNRWEHPHLKYAFCIERYGNVYTVIHGASPVAIKGLKWTPANKEIALEVLTNRYNEYGENNSSEITNTKTIAEKNLHDTVVEFSKLHFPKWSLPTRHSYNVAFHSYLPDNYLLSDIDTIRNMINTQIKKLGHHPNTQLKYLSKLNTFFKYCIDQEYITRNPVINPMKPEPVPPVIKVFSREEVEQIIHYMANYSAMKFKDSRSEYRASIKYETNLKQLALMVEFVSYSGLRISEALKLWWDVPEAPLILNDVHKRKSVITEKSIIIDGKRSTHKTPRIREFPLSLVPELFPIIEKLKEFKEANKGKVFRWNYSSKIEIMLRDVVAELKLEGDRSFHILRKTALNYWEKSLGIPANISKYMAGHSAATREKFYSTEPSADELINMFDKFRD